MSHPIMFDEDDPLLARVRALCLAFPGAQEKVSHGRPVFYTVKVFCHYGGSVRAPAGQVRHDSSILVVPEPALRPALEADERFFFPAYLGPHGWVGLDLDDPDWDEVADLVEDSYRMTAPARLVAQLHERPQP